MCGIGVTSLIERILNPELAKDLMAESLPAPTPETITSISTGPDLATFSPMAATILEAAKGVAFFGPEKPSDPAVAQAKTPPLSSVIVIIVLL